MWQTTASVTSVAASEDWHATQIISNVQLDGPADDPRWRVATAATAATSASPVSHSAGTSGSGSRGAHGSAGGNSAHVLRVAEGVLDAQAPVGALRLQLICRHASLPPPGPVAGRGVLPHLHGERSRALVSLRCRRFLSAPPPAVRKQPSMNLCINTYMSLKMFPSRHTRHQSNVLFPHPGGSTAIKQYHHRLGLELCMLNVATMDLNPHVNSGSLRPR